MTSEQQAFINNMSVSQARRVIRKFGSDPERAFSTSPAAFCAFREAWEIAFPGEYIQHRDYASGHEFSIITKTEAPNDI